MPSTVRSYPVLQPRDRPEWRSWLEGNHARSPGVWVTYFKKASGKQGLTYEEAVEEALCFGWIDGLVNAVDEERYRQLFSPRKKGSTWAKTNKRRVEKLIEQGLMTPAGLAKIEEAKADGSWYQLDHIDEAMVPEDLAAALRARPGAEGKFNALSPSKRRQFLYHLTSAKRAETRKKRVLEIVDIVEEGKSIEDLGRRRKAP